MVTGERISLNNLVSSELTKKHKNRERKKKETEQKILFRTRFTVRKSFSRNVVRRIRVYRHTGRTQVHNTKRTI